jgi:hypothetical protein
MTTRSMPHIATPWTMVFIKQSLRNIADGLDMSHLKDRSLGSLAPKWNIAGCPRISRTSQPPDSSAKTLKALTASRLLLSCHHAKSCHRRRRGLVVRVNRGSFGQASKAMDRQAGRLARTGCRAGRNRSHTSGHSGSLRRDRCIDVASGAARPEARAHYDGRRHRGATARLHASLDRGGRRSRAVVLHRRGPVVGSRKNVIGLSGGSLSP